MPGYIKTLFLRSVTSRLKTRKSFSKEEVKNCLNSSGVDFFAITTILLTSLEDCLLRMNSFFLPIRIFSRCARAWANRVSHIFLRISRLHVNSTIPSLIILDMIKGHRIRFVRNFAEKMGITDFVKISFEKIKRS